MSSNPGLLRVGEVIDRLKIPRPQLVNLRGHMHMLAISDTNRRFAAPYVEAFRGYVLQELADGNSGAGMYLPTIRDFIRSRPLDGLLESTERNLQTELEAVTDDDGMIRARDFSKTLRLGRMSVTNMQDNGQLKTRRFPDDREVYIAADELTHVLRWQRPRWD